MNNFRIINHAMSSITQILETDRASRYAGIESDLFTIDKLVSDKTLDYDLPTLVSNDFDYNSSIKLCNDINEFKTAFYAKYPPLVGLSLDNLIIAGGSVGNIVKKPKGYCADSDVDFFMYGLSEEDANVRVKQWITGILSCAKDYAWRETERKNINKNRPDKRGSSDISTECEMIRNNNTILIIICGHKFQLIFRLYKTPSEILHGFDLGSSAIGFDGENVYLTSLGKFCYEHSCNVVDTTRRSTTYEYRLEKYFQRGFNIVIPSLDKKQLRLGYFKYNLDEVCALPYFVFSYSAVSGNKISVRNFYNKYSETSDYQLDDINEYNTFRMNLYNLVNDINFFYSTSSSSDTNNIEILAKGPRLSKGSIVSYYETIREKLNNKKIDITLLKNYVTVESPATVALNIIQNLDSHYLDNLIERQTKLVLDKLQVLQNRDHTKIHWIIKDPGTQLCGSFNPIFKEEKDWYGTYYNPNSRADEIESQSQLRSLDLIHCEDKYIKNNDIEDRSNNNVSDVRDVRDVSDVSDEAENSVGPPSDSDNSDISITVRI